MAILTIISFPKKMSLKESFKLLELSHEQMLSGRLFHRSGAATAKALDQ